MAEESDPYRSRDLSAPSRVLRKHNLRTMGVIPVQGFINNGERSPLRRLVGYANVCVSDDGYIYRKNPNLYEIWVRCEYWEDFGKSPEYDQYNVRTAIGYSWTWWSWLTTLVFGEWQVPKGDGPAT